jgi:hypothetical protein
MDSLQIQQNHIMKIDAFCCNGVHLELGPMLFDKRLYQLGRFILGLRLF